MYESHFIKKNIEKIFFFIFALSIPFIIYYYFYPWRTQTIYGDDLFIFKDLASSKNFSDIIKSYIHSGKYRPIHAFSSSLIFKLFQKEIYKYFLFNVLMQSLNTYLLALNINLFIKSPIKSLLFALVFGISRFCLYNITQLFNGGALEGLAMSFFLLTFFFITKAIFDENSKIKMTATLIWSLFFANICTYTHERYIVLFLFILFIVIFYPNSLSFNKKNRILIGSISIVSVLVNIGIKKLVYNMPFFMGTGGANIKISIPQIFQFLCDGIFSIFQLNQGPEYLVGLTYKSLSLYNLVFVITFISLLFFTLLTYFPKKIIKIYRDDKDKKITFFLFSLLVLFFVCLIPAVVTIRLEHRWLQASFSICVIFLIIALTFVSNGNKSLGTILSVFFFLSYIYLNDLYLKNGVCNIYLKTAENISSIFNDSNYIRNNSNTLYIWHKQNDSNTNNEIKWSIADGYLYDFYKNKKINIVFVDSIYIEEKLKDFLENTTNKSCSMQNCISTFEKRNFQVLSIKENHLLDIGSIDFYKAD